MKDIFINVVVTIVSTCVGNLLSHFIISLM